MQITIGRALRGLTSVAAFAGALSIAGTALAGECPAGKARAGDLVPAVGARGAIALRAHPDVIAGQAQLVAVQAASLAEHHVV